MTKCELAKALHLSSQVISDAIAQVEADRPGFLPRDLRKLSFNKKEMIEICRHIKYISEIELIMLSETVFKDPEHRRPLSKERIKDEEFIEKQKKNRKIHVCGNCKCLIGRSEVGETSKLYPFCTYYDRYMKHMRVLKDGRSVKANIYEDNCENWVRGEPRIWNK